MPSVFNIFARHSLKLQNNKKDKYIFGAIQFLGLSEDGYTHILKLAAYITNSEPF